MKYLVDTHTHTIVSGHAYSTLTENIEVAKKNGIKILGTTEHGPAMPGAPHLFYFGNLKILPRVINDVIILKGCEANIIDFEGNLDLPEDYQNNLDVMVASLHDVCIEPGTKEENTNAVVNAMKNKLVDIIGHPGNPRFPIDEEKMVKEAKERNVLIEINNSSFLTSRVGSEKTCTKILELCKKHNVPIIVNSDSHYCEYIGKFDKADEIINRVDFPEELVINTNKKKFIKYLQKKGKAKDIILD